MTARGPSDQPGSRTFRSRGEGDPTRTTRSSVQAWRGVGQRGAAWRLFFAAVPRQAAPAQGAPTTPSAGRGGGGRGDPAAGWRVAPEGGPEGGGAERWGVLGGLCGGHVPRRRVAR